MSSVFNEYTTLSAPARSMAHEKHSFRISNASLQVLNIDASGGLTRDLPTAVVLLHNRTPKAAAQDRSSDSRKMSRKIWRSTSIKSVTSPLEPLAEKKTKRLSGRPYASNHETQEAIPTMSFEFSQVNSATYFGSEAISAPRESTTQQGLTSTNKDINPPPSDGVGTLNKEL